MSKEKILDGLKKGKLTARIAEVFFEGTQMLSKGKAEFVYMLSQAVGRPVAPKDFDRFRKWIDTEKRKEILANLGSVSIIGLWNEFNGTPTCDGCDGCNDDEIDEDEPAECCDNCGCEECECGMDEDEIDEDEEEPENNDEIR